MYFLIQCGSFGRFHIFVVVRVYVYRCFLVLFGEFRVVLYRVMKLVLFRC